MSHRIESIDDLERLYAPPLATSAGKESPRINDLYRRLIEAAPFCAVASVGPEGMDCSPRGDAPGFVRILNDKTIAIPDRRGNNRLDTLRNIVRDGRVGLLFMIPGLNETLRVNGTAHLSTDPDLVSAFAVDGKRPVSAIVVAVETIYFQCARALKRSKLWDAGAQVDPKTLPSAGQLIRSVIGDFDSESYDAELPDRQARTLY
jgi:PPOX class probable FMN-dependent enzyme